MRSGNQKSSRRRLIENIFSKIRLNRRSAYLNVQRHHEQKRPKIYPYEHRRLCVMNQLIENTPGGLFCRAGKFYIDPRRPVPKAVITHAHADHARGGSSSYPCSRDRLFPRGFRPLLKRRRASSVGCSETVSVASMASSMLSASTKLRLWRIFRGYHHVRPAAGGQIYDTFTTDGSSRSRIGPISGCSKTHKTRAS